jgi:hypothetical protein
MQTQQKRTRLPLVAASLWASVAAGALAAPPAPPLFDWATVVNNTDPMPGAPGGRRFNSYNQPSVNVNGLVVLRARSRGGDGSGPATHGIYSRNMAVAGAPVVRILDRATEVPQPNNLGTRFVETPAFPRIDMSSSTIATRGNHQPVWRYDLDDAETRAGTTGTYTNPFGPLITGASKLGAVPDFEFFEVPEAPGTPFDVFPGAPAVTDGATLVFKGNYTVGSGRTGVYFRDLENAEAGGTGPVVLIANNTETLIPGTNRVFGSVSPPSAVGRVAVFAGFDDEDAPTLGGIYRVPLAERPALAPLVRIGGRVPGESVGTFKGLGEGMSFDGRYVGFWGAWGTRTRAVRLYCPTEGNRDRIDYCNRDLVCDGRIWGDPNSVCDATGCYQVKRVPVEQGIFVHDTTGNAGTRTVAKTGARFDDFLTWSYSGRTPCVSGGEGGEDDGEAVRWRSSAFVGVSGPYVAFKAATGDIVGIYLNRLPGQDIFTVLDTRTDGQAVDPEAPAGSRVATIGIEREGLRGRWLVINVTMGVEGGSEEEGMAGIYVTRTPR